MPKINLLKKVENLFRKRRVVTMSDLCVAIGSSSRMTVFRKIRQMAYVTSYTHAGRYYTLHEIARFDSERTLIRSSSFHIPIAFVINFHGISSGIAQREFFPMHVIRHCAQDQPRNPSLNPLSSSLFRQSAPVSSWLKMNTPNKPLQDFHRYLFIQLRIISD